MKIFFFLILSILILESCGKKSNPQYQGKVERQMGVIL